MRIHRSQLVASRAGLRWFVVRVIALVAVLGVPILGTSYALVSSVTADIAMADAEHVQLTAFAKVVELIPRIEAVHDDIVDGNAAAERTDRLAGDRAFAAAQQAYAGPNLFAATRAVWQRWHRQWALTQRRRSSAGIDEVLDVLQEIGNELDDDSPLEIDPNVAVQNLVALILWQSPRSIVSIRRTADDVSAARGPRLDNGSIERITRGRALESQPLKRLFADIPLAVSIEPSAGGELNRITGITQRRTRAFEIRIDRILSAFRIEPTDGAVIERLARHAIDAHLLLWRASIAASDRIIIHRRSASYERRRLIIALSLMAVLLGTLAVTLAVRQMARRDRIDLASAKLESDKLRAELQQLSTERALRLQEAQFRSVFENANLGIAIFNLDGTLAECNTAVRTILGDDAPRLLELWALQVTTFQAAREPFTLEERHSRTDGSTQWLARTLSGVYADGACQLVILLLRDTTEEKLLQASLLHAANHDGLTQIANRAAFERELRLRLASAAEPLAVFYIDLDNFKPVNDTFGHAAGDAVLVATAERLRAALSSDDLCARLGGDEFAAIVRVTNDPATLNSIAARIGTSIAEPVVFGDCLLAVTASIGVAPRWASHVTPDALKVAADRALYAVKQRGGNDHRIDGDQRLGVGAEAAAGSSVPVGVAASSVFAPSCVASIL